MLRFGRKSPLDFLPEHIKEVLTDKFKDEEAESLVSLGTLLELEPGTDLTVEGTIGYEVMVIVEGEADVIRQDQVLATLKPGDIVGEMSVISGERRTATVTAKTKLSAYVLSPREFNSLMNQQPRLGNRITTDAIRRFAVNETESDE